MLVDDSRFPLVFLRSHAESSATINQQFEDLLEKRQLFVLITDHADDDHEDETKEERKEKALFFKQIKDRMRSFCRGMIVIEGRMPLNAAMRVTAAAASKALGFSVLFALDEDEAAAKGMLLLEKDAA
ncbi:hypothetical protein ACE10Z_05150 [Bradyrhizobium sp. Pha-3]|uniref:hypothetical protein n=1 Tax=Bradyrhizobium sp. Pha-3 TaxID=208375 RepID=UPI0035D465C6